MSLMISASSSSQGKKRHKLQSYPGTPVLSSQEKPFILKNLNPKRHTLDECHPRDIMETTSNFLVFILKKVEKEITQ